MSLFTGKGDNGTTTRFGCNQRFSKSSLIAEALGNVDAINSYLGLLKVKTRETIFEVGEAKFFEIIEDVQQNLFIIQAELAGADKKIKEEKVLMMSEMINQIEKKLPLIKTFFVSGGCELSSMFDYARTLARTAERRVVAAQEEGLVKVDPNTSAYLNRLSSLLYALARLSNHLSNINEIAPDYQ